MGRYMKPEGLRALYSGFLPYAGMLWCASWAFPGMWSEEKKQIHFGILEGQMLENMKVRADANKRGYGF